MSKKEFQTKNSKINVRSTTVILTTFAIMMAAEVILNLLEIHTGTIKINLAFIPVVIAAHLYGAVGGALVYGLGDVIGCIVHPVGAWYPPITLTYAVIGCIFGLILHRRKGIVPCITAVFINQAIISLFVTSLWIAVLTFRGDSSGFFTFYFTATIPARLVSVLIMTAVQLVMIPLIINTVDRIGFTQKLRPVISENNDKK